MGYCLVGPVSGLRGRARLYGLLHALPIILTSSSALAVGLSDAVPADGFQVSYLYDGAPPGEVQKGAAQAAAPSAGLKPLGYYLEKHADQASEIAPSPYLKRRVENQKNQPNAELLRHAAGSSLPPVPDFDPGNAAKASSVEPSTGYMEAAQKNAKAALTKYSQHRFHAIQSAAAMPQSAEESQDRVDLSALDRVRPGNIGGPDAATAGLDLKQVASQAPASEMDIPSLISVEVPKNLNGAPQTPDYMSMEREQGLESRQAVAAEVPKVDVRTLSKLPSVQPPEIMFLAGGAVSDFQLSAGSKPASVDSLMGEGFAEMMVETVPVDAFEYEVAEESPQEPAEEVVAVSLPVVAPVKQAAENPVAASMQNTPMAAMPLANKEPETAPVVVATNDLTKPKELLTMRPLPVLADSTKAVDDSQMPGLTALPKVPETRTAAEPVKNSAVVAMELEPAGEMSDLAASSAGAVGEDQSDIDIDELTRSVMKALAENTEETAIASVKAEADVEAVNVRPEEAAEQLAQLAPEAGEKKVEAAKAEVLPPASAAPISDVAAEILAELPAGALEEEKLTLDEDVEIEHNRVPSLELARDENVREHEGTGIRIQIKKASFRVDEYLRKAQTEMQSGEYTRAIDYYEKILGKKTDHPRALFGLATSYHRAGELDKAQAVYQRILSKDSRNKAALHNMIVLVSQKSPDDALNYLHELRAKNPSVAAIPAKIALIYANHGRFDEAVGQLRQAIHIEPENTIYRYHLAIVLDNAGYQAEAIHAYRLLSNFFHQGRDIPVNIAKIQERLTFLMSNIPV